MLETRPPPSGLHGLVHALKPAAGFLGAGTACSTAAISSAASTPAPAPPPPLPAADTLHPWLPGCSTASKGISAGQQQAGRQLKPLQVRWGAFACCRRRRPPCRWRRRLPARAWVSSPHLLPQLVFLNWNLCSHGTSCAVAPDRLEQGLLGDLGHRVVVWGTHTHMAGACVPHLQPGHVTKQLGRHLRRSTAAGRLHCQLDALSGSLWLGRK